MTNALGKPHRSLLLTARIGVTCLCGAALLTFVEPWEVWRDLSRMNGTSLLVSFLLHALIIVLLSWRWRSVLALLGVLCPTKSAIDMTFVATFFNTILPFSIGGDIWRVWIGRRAGIDPGIGVTGTVLDRLFGLVALGLFLLLAVILLPTGTVPSMVRYAMAFLLPATLLVISVLSALARLKQRKGGIASRHITTIGEKLRSAFDRPGNVLLIMLQSLLAHLTAVATALAIAAGLGLDLSISDALLLIPVMLFATMLPISIGGWGAREAAAVPLLAFAGIPPSGALSLGLIFGLTQLATSGTGALLIFLIGEFGESRRTDARRRMAESARSRAISP